VSSLMTTCVPRLERRGRVYATWSGEGRPPVEDHVQDSRSPGSEGKMGRGPPAPGRRVIQ
jgi:hypothetical protein